MGILCWILMFGADEPSETLAKQMLPIYVTEAESYSLVVDTPTRPPVVLKKEPVFEWLNPARNAQQGAVFLWLREGRPSALACIFSQPHDKLPGRQIMHELHALDAERLQVTRKEYNQWKPQAGFARKELPESAAPAASPGARLLQMRRLAQEFTGHSLDRDGKRWELRLLPTPLYRYPVSSMGVVDGALFALVSSAGTDPEVLLILEAKEVDGTRRWEYACGRFSDWELHVHRRDREVYSSVPSETNPFFNDPLHLYRIYPEKVVSLQGKTLAKIRQTPTVPWGEVIPVEDK